MSNKILVIGSNGTVGQEIVNQLRAKAEPLKLATSKSPSSNEYVQLNLSTGEGLDSAFEGVDRAFLLSPPGFADQYSLLSPAIAKAKEKALKKVVLMTAMGADADENSAFRRAELELIQSGMDYNIIRPNWFFQNFNTFWLHDLLEERKIKLPAGDAKVSFIDSRDISSVAVKLLTTDEFVNKEFNLTGPESINHREVADAIENEIGETVEYKEVEPQVLGDVLLNVGLPKDYVDFMLLIFGYLKEGYNSQITNSVEEIIGRKPISLNQYVADNKKSWLK
ncbi:MAG: nucleoside-diphosphate sugar epimerase [Bdellovibrionaceae bacterium]|nr:nucleoside-diphosphate sugar epimerase [Pseudobdellovibrionaceae bacterium]|tara:strand:- start:4813 stop:5652 length:840 start_codon:yes stop_codon:yes gene_type:complete